MITSKSLSIKESKPKSCKSWKRDFELRISWIRKLKHQCYAPLSIIPRAKELPPSSSSGKVNESTGSLWMQCWMTVWAVWLHEYVRVWRCLTLMALLSSRARKVNIGVMRAMTASSKWPPSSAFRSSIRSCSRNTGTTRKHLTSFLKHVYMEFNLIDRE